MARMEIDLTWSGKLLRRETAGSEPAEFREWLSANGVDLAVVRSASVRQTPDGKQLLFLHRYCLNAEGRKYLDGDSPAMENVVVTPSVPLPEEMWRPDVRYAPEET